MLLNAQIWTAINSHDYSKAAQFYLLAQHIHTGLRLLKRDMIEKLPILKDIKNNLDELRNKILEMNKQKLQTINLTPEVCIIILFKFNQLVIILIIILGSK